MLRRWLAAGALASVTILGWSLTGCDQPVSNTNDNLAGNAPQNNQAPTGQPGDGRVPVQAAPAGGAVAPSNTEIKGAMTKLAKGPTSLTSVLGNELKSESPPWDQIQAQTKEYVQLVTGLAKYDPPKGSKESWQEQTAAYAKLATDLDQAAQKKDADAALTAHGNITKSCMGCHREHRVMGGPGGGPGGPGGFGRPGGGGPPGGGYPGQGYPGGTPPGGGQGAPPQGEAPKG
jgi:cytochrome c556